jgi:chain length determinant protein tyrosine kinase EpsG
MTLIQFLSILRARWKVMLVVLMLAVTATAVVNAVLPRSYTSTAAVLVDVKSPDPIAGIFFQGLTSPSYMATQVDVIQSDRVSEQVVRALRLDQVPSMRQQWREATLGEGNFEIWLANLLRRSLDVKPSRESNVITIAYKSVDPKFATSLANAYARAYIDVTLELRVEPAKQYGRFFEERAKQLREKVEQARARISTFQREKGIVGADERLDVETSRLNELSSQLTVLQALRSESSSRQAQARSSADQLQDVINNSVISNLKGELSRQEARLSELSARLDDNHPSVVELRANIGQLRSRIEQETRRISGGVTVSNAINGSRLQLVQAALDEQRVKVLRLKEVRDQLAVLASDLDSSQRAYEAVISRANQTELESRTTQTNVTILNPASEPSQPSSPRVTLNMLLALFVGTLLAVGVAMLLELFDRRVRSAGDVAQALDIGLLGVLSGRSRGRLLGRRAAHAPASSRRLGSAAMQTGAVGTAPPARGTRREALPPVQGGDPAGHSPRPSRGPGNTPQGTDAATDVVPRAIGDIFRETRQLDSAGIERIIAYQREHHLLFGEAAVALHLVEAADVQWALSQQFRYPYASADRKRFDTELIVANAPFSTLAESFRGIRSQLIKRLGHDAQRRSIAIVSADDGDGKSFVAANLAVAFSQLGRRTLLIDADMRTPRLDALFQIERGNGLSSILSGRAPLALSPVPDLPSLFVLPVGTLPPNPLELLESGGFGALLNDLAAEFDYVIVDTPSASHGADAGVISARGGAYLTVARRGRTRMDAMGELVQSLRDPMIEPLGFIINEH